MLSSEQVSRCLLFRILLWIGRFRISRFLLRRRSYLFLQVVLLEIDGFQCEGFDELLHIFSQRLIEAYHVFHLTFQDRWVRASASSMFIGIENPCKAFLMTVGSALEVPGATIKDLM